jgi:hypothetical protein
LVYLYDICTFWNHLANDLLTIWPIMALKVDRVEAKAGDLIFLGLMVNELSIM